ncbi:long-chain acyl-CoA oxidase [Coccomyxa subellipsoidea C-169]|uniref:Acyl-coenzyme A oxidase n=1 Tax=Coccomyxa subellipsoidea (strain C-169) TaxID=574566 RepID=I0YTI6_COCSC|nr:long-chain acyl-CoA oxidase [Coccomyxa subellipsoidea C-169]EIE21705.1 long-chain acyl-CoA oxidase [Coccomyxa subellipsoidea C-169]|eukprot:XP_005646249.1 long-chain acyl-CoA oxidase [Coccomyxa subellipsoidea C-169]
MADAGPLQRLGVLLKHLTLGDTDGHNGIALSPTAARGVSLPRFDTTVMESYLDELSSVKEDVYETFRHRPNLLPATLEGLSKEEHRELARQQLKLLLKAGYSPLRFYLHDIKKYFYLGELLAVVDLSLTVKMGVQYNLWGGSILNLGTEKHKKAYFEDIDKFRLPGCFAMTELYHGSNVAALQTEAVLDIATDEWIISTPDDGALKWWIGNAAEDGRAATVFARLKVPSPDGSGTLVDHGVHAIVVPLRDEAGTVLQGVEIKDCGYKVGLNGVDNGSIRFLGVRVPRENLLDRFASVDRSGQYRSPYSASRRFAATLGELTGGRVGLICSSLGVLKASLTVAVRYGATRQQFGPANAPEIAVLDYSSQQEKLMPMLASAYAIHFTSRYLVDQYAEAKRTKEEDVIADVHALSAGLKAYVTNYTATALSVCRECCGGHGYAAVNRFGMWRSDHDIFQTFEGDNTVLLQQVAGLLLKKYKERFAVAPVTATYRYLRQWAAESLPPNPLVSHETSVRHLRDPAFLVRALRYRTGKLLFTLAQRLSKHTRRMGQFQAWNKCLSHILTLARAHIESVMFERFLDGVNNCPDADCKKSLKVMAEVFALQRIQADVMFRNDDYVAAEKVKAIGRLLERLRAEIRAQAVPLVDAFNIPDHILRSPIGLSHQDPYDHYLEGAGWTATTPLTS